MLTCHRQVATHAYFGMTKAVTAIGVMLLVEEGKLRLSDPASTTLPEFKNMKGQGGGWDGSAGTFFAVDPSRELVVTLMTQHLPANPDGLRQKFKAAVQHALIN